MGHSGLRRLIYVCVELLGALEVDLAHRITKASVNGKGGGRHGSEMDKDPHNDMFGVWQVRHMEDTELFGRKSCVGVVKRHRADLTLAQVDGAALFAKALAIQVAVVVQLASAVRSGSSDGPATRRSGRTKSAFEQQQDAHAEEQRDRARSSSSGGKEQRATRVRRTGGCRFRGSILRSDHWSGARSSIAAAAFSQGAGTGGR